MDLRDKIKRVIDEMEKRIGSGGVMINPKISLITVSYKALVEYDADGRCERCGTPFPSTRWFIPSGVLNERGTLPNDAIKVIENERQEEDVALYIKIILDKKEKANN